ncbi:hypothetical protein, partial [Mesorhizobium sp. B2-5-4]|uniref:hypothetical protein n=1 Tax=Mesorhizobium sp. B2-5-4 TaxID=2589926 RepID=UPI001AED6033
KASKATKMAALNPHNKPPAILRNGPLAGEGRSATLRLAKLRSAAILAAKIISRTGKLVSRTARLK